MLLGSCLLPRLYRFCVHGRNVALAGSETSWVVLMSPCPIVSKFVALLTDIVFNIFSALVLGMRSVTYSVACSIWFCIFQVDLFLAISSSTFSNFCTEGTEKSLLWRFWWVFNTMFVYHSDVQYFEGLSAYCARGVWGQHDIFRRHIFGVLAYATLEQISFYDARFKARINADQTCPRTESIARRCGSTWDTICRNSCDR